MAFPETYLYIISISLYIYIYISVRWVNPSCLRALSCQSFFAPGRAATIASKGLSEAKFIKPPNMKYLYERHFCMAFGGCHLGMVTTALNLADISETVMSETC